MEYKDWPVSANYIANLTSLVKRSLFMTSYVSLFVTIIVILLNIHVFTNHYYRGILLHSHIREYIQEIDDVIKEALTVGLGGRR